MPTNLYGPGDNYHPENSHVVPGLMRRIHEAKLDNAPQVVIWGSGKPLRELMYSDDLADATLLLMKEYSDHEPINVGSGIETSILDLAREISSVVGFTGQLIMDTTKPDGTRRKYLDSHRLHTLGFKARTALHDGLAQTYREWLKSSSDSEGFQEYPA